MQGRKFSKLSAWHRFKNGAEKRAGLKAHPYDCQPQRLKPSCYRWLVGTVETLP